MLNEILSMFSYTFLLRAFGVGILISLCAALLGVSLVLKRYSMIGDGLSHVGFGALALATALNLAPLAVAIPVVVAAAFLLLRLRTDSKIKGDAAIALISTGALAVGVMIITFSPGGNSDLNGYLFGSILAMSRGDVILSLTLSAAVLILFVLFYTRIFAVTFDETFARATGTGASRYHGVLSVLTALTIVVGMRLMGSLLISALIIFPPLTSMRLFKNFRAVVICSAAVSAICFVIGMTVSYLFSAPAGASVVCVHLLAFCVASAVSLFGKKAS